MSSPIKCNAKSVLYHLTKQKFHKMTMKILVKVLRTKNILNKR